MKENLICIACPRGCRLHVTRGADGTLNVEGYFCPKGIEYAERESVNPMRLLTSTVRTDDPRTPRLPVRLSAEIPLEKVFECMRSLNGVVARRPVKPGDILVRDFFGKGTDLVATGEL